MFILKYLYKAIEKSINDDGVEHAGYMAFMVILALFPFLVFFLALTSFFGASELGQKLIEIIIQSSPETAVDSIRIRLEELKEAPPTSLVNLAIFGTIWTASSFVEGLRTILNRTFEVSSPPPYIFRRFLSITQFILLCGIIAAVLYLFIFIPILMHKMNLDLPIKISEQFIYSRYVYIFFAIFFCVIGFYTFIPNSKISFISMIPGALLTTITWLASGYLLSKYIKYYNQLNIVYGSVGSIIITMLFFYVINYLFIVGAAFNYYLSMHKSDE
jgi:membrane protein